MRLALLSKENPERMGNRKCQRPIAFYGAKRREYVATYRGSLGVHSFSSIVPEVWLSKDTFWNGWAGTCLSEASLLLPQPLLLAKGSFPWRCEISVKRRQWLICIIGELSISSSSNSVSGWRGWSPSWRCQQCCHAQSLLFVLVIWRTQKLQPGVWPFSRDHPLMLVAAGQGAKTIAGCGDPRRGRPGSFSGLWNHWWWRMLNTRCLHYCCGVFCKANNTSFYTNHLIEKKPILSSR